MTLRRRLLLLVFGVLLPMAALFAWMVFATYERELETARQHLKETARALALVVDRELDKRAVIAHTLASTTGLMEGDHHRFYLEARAATEGTGNWVLLVDADNQLVNTRAAFGAPLPPRPADPKEPLALDAPRASRLRKDPVTHTPALAVFVPVPNVTPPHFNVGVVFTPEALQDILTEQRLPPGWIGAVVDTGNVIVARTPNPERAVGRRATPEMLAALERDNEGFSEAITVDGIQVRAFFSRSPRYGWHFVIGVPTALLTASARSAAWTLGVSAALLTAFALGLALWSARRIRRPIEALERAARELGQDRIPALAPSGLLEADAVGAALHRAGVQAAQASEELERRVAAALEAARMERERHDALQRVLAEELLNLIADNLPVLIAYVDRETRYRLNNKAYETWFGRPRDTILGKTMRETLGEAAWAQVQPHLEHALLGEPQRFEAQIDYPALGPRWVETHYIPHRSPQGEVEGVAVLVHDVSEQRSIHDALADAARRKDEFLATLAHELRNPLAPITSALQVLRLKDPADPQLRWTRDVLDRQVRHLTRLVDDLMDVARITRGRIELRRERLEVATVVQSAVEAARPQITAAGHELDLALPAGPLLLEADGTRLSQVLLNLLTNAAKYTPPGGRIEVRVREEGGEAVLSVRDNGIGLAPEHLDSVFEMFSQVAPALERSQGGLGIGLALARGLVELHGGRLDAFSAGVGQGTEFVIRLPLARPAAVAGPSPQAAPSRTRALKVLVVDDNRDAAESLAMLLQLLGHETFLAHDGPSALAAFDAAPCDLVLLDIGMPGMNGYEVARRLRSRPAGRLAMLAALTGWGQDEDRRRAAEAGFDDHVTKPVEEDRLAEVLDKAAGRRDAGGPPANA